MKAATYTQGGAFSIEELPLPNITSNEILLKVMASSICGTDLRIIRNGHRKLADGQRIVLGHEFTGQIVKVGKNIHDYAEGMRVAVAPNYGCGTCRMCVKGLTHMCPEYSAFGICMDGAFADYVRIPAEVIAQGNLTPLPDTISWAEATLIEPFSCVVNGLSNCKVNLGDIVVVFGAGPIGLMHLMLANVMGATRVIMADPLKARLDKAMQIGAAAVVDVTQPNAFEQIMALTGGKGADVVVTACPVPLVQEQSLKLLAPYGRVSFFGGLPKGQDAVKIDTNLVHYKNLTLTGMTGSSLDQFRTAMELIAAKKVDIGQVISHVFSSDQMDEAFKVAMSGDCMKVVIQDQA